MLRLHGCLRKGHAAIESRGRGNILFTRGVLVARENRNAPMLFVVNGVYDVFFFFGNADVFQHPRSPHIFSGRSPEQTSRRNSLCSSIFKFSEIWCSLQRVKGLLWLQLELGFSMPSQLSEIVSRPHTTARHRNWLSSVRRICSGR